MNDIEDIISLAKQNDAKALKTLHRAAEYLGEGIANLAHGLSPETIVIGGGFSEPALEPGMATNPVPVDGFQSTNAYKQAIGIIESFEIM